MTDEWWQKGTAFDNRADVLFLINGIPVAIAQTKGEGVADGIAKGIHQIRCYDQQTRDLLAFPQLFEVTELWNFWYGLTIVAMIHKFDEPDRLLISTPNCIFFCPYVYLTR